MGEFRVDMSHSLFKPGDADMDSVTADYVEDGVPICRRCNRGGWQLMQPCGKFEVLE